MPDHSTTNPTDRSEPSASQAKPSRHPDQSNHPDDSHRATPTPNLPQDLSDFISARIELASIEAREAAEYAAQKANNGIILAVAAFFTWCLILAGLIGIFGSILDRLIMGKDNLLSGWVIVALLFAALHGTAAFLFYKKLKEKPETPLFALSLQELEHDKQWLKKNT